MAPSFLCPSNARDQLRAAWRAPCAPSFEEMRGGATSARGVTRGPTAASRCSTAIPHERHRGRRRPRRLSGHRTATKLMYVGRHWAWKEAALGGEGPRAWEGRSWLLSPPPIWARRARGRVSKSGTSENRTGAMFTSLRRLSNARANLRAGWRAPCSPPCGATLGRAPARGVTPGPSG